MANDWLQKRCRACEGGAAALDHKQVQDFSSQLPEWQLVEAKRLRRSVKLPDFQAALTLGNRIGALAEAEGHHPDLLIRYGSLEVELWTHAVGGLTENDFIMAAKIDEIISH